MYFYQLDQLGTPLSLTDSENNIVWQAHYSVFGKATVTVNKIDNPIRFQGQYFDNESGLHYNHFRYYDPETGRFISQDPIGLLGGINHYQYAPNHINWIDPLGLSCKEGYAYIYHYKGSESPHFAVVVEHNGEKYGTEQWGGLNGGIPTKTLDIEFDPKHVQGMELVEVYKVRLPDAEAAMKHQKKMVSIGESKYAQANYEAAKFDTPDYNAETKSCLTHVFDVLNAGGRDAPESSPPNRSTYNFMKGIQNESKKLKVGD